MSSIGKVNAALAAAVVFLLLSSGSAYLALSRLKTNESWVRHTRDVQSALAQYAMTTARAGRLRVEYISSGDDATLQKYAGLVDQLRGTIASIQRLTTDNAQEQMNSSRLAELTEQRIASMDESVALERAGKSTLLAQAEVTREIVATAEDVDHTLQRMYDEEDQLLAQRQARVQRSSSLTITILVISLFLALLLFLIHHRLLTEQVKARTRAEGAQRALSARLLTVQDEERRKFARELHDSVGQHLAALKMALSLLQPRLPGDAVLADCFKLLDDSISETRTISYLLHPPLLDEAGLSSASRWFVEGFGKRSGIDVHLDIHGKDDRLPAPVELVLFRVLQESLTNVHRHSGARRADVNLYTEGGNAILRVKDNGRGMPAAVLHNFREDGSSGGVGLAGMAERIREIGGTIELHSNGSGTEVVARVPVNLNTAQLNSAMQELKP